MSLYTKDQIETALDAFGFKNEPLPGKGKQLIIAFPRGGDFSRANIKKTDKKSTYGKVLYSLEFVKWEN